MTKLQGIPARIFAATVAIWLALLLTAPVPLDACPMHGSHALHGVLQAAHSGHHAARHGGAPQKSSHQCTCIGDCSISGSAFAATPADEIALPDARIIQIVQPLRAVAVLPHRLSVEHSLPPANGPPSIS